MKCKVLLATMMMFMAGFSAFSSQALDPITPGKKQHHQDITKYLVNRTFGQRMMDRRNSEFRNPILKDAEHFATRQQKLKDHESQIGSIQKDLDTRKNDREKSRMISEQKVQEKNNLPGISLNEEQVTLMKDNPALFKSMLEGDLEIWMSIHGPKQIKSARIAEDDESYLLLDVQKQMYDFTGDKYDDYSVTKFTYMETNKYYEYIIEVNDDGSLGDTLYAYMREIVDEDDLFYYKSYEYKELYNGELKTRTKYERTHIVDEDDDLYFFYTYYYNGSYYWDSTTELYYLGYESEQKRDDNGLWISQEQTEYDAEGNVTDGWRTSVDYDDNDNPIKETDEQYDADTDTWLLYAVEEYIYDSEGNLISETSVDYFEDGTVSYESEYMYDADGNTVSYASNEYYENGNMAYTSERLYFENGNQQSSSYKYYYEDGTLAEESSSEYFDNYMTKSNSYTTYNEDGSKSYHYSYMYNENGEQTSYVYEDYDDTGTLMYGNRQTTEIDNNGNVTSEIWENYDSISEMWVGSSKYTYVYDANGNLTEEANYYWDSTDEKFIGSEKTTYIFDGEDMITSAEQFNWDHTAGDWDSMANLRGTWTYDGDSYVILVEMNDGSDNWSNYERETLTVSTNNDGNIEEVEMYEQWNSTDSEWMITEKSESVIDPDYDVELENYQYNYDYTAMKLVLSSQSKNDFIVIEDDDGEEYTRQTLYEYYYVSGTYAYGYRYVYVYDHPTNPFSQTMYTYEETEDTDPSDGITWILNTYSKTDYVVFEEQAYTTNSTYYSTYGYGYRYIYEYNDEGMQTSYVNEETEDVDAASINDVTWYTTYRVTQTYDANGNQTMYFAENDFNYDTKVLNPSYKYEYTYDANENLTVFTYYYWNGEALVKNFTTSYSYNDMNQTTEILTEYFQEDGTVYSKERSLYNYAESGFSEYCAVTVDGDNVLTGDDVTLTASIASGGDMIEYMWMDPQGNELGMEASATLSESGKYTVEVFNGACKVKVNAKVLDVCAVTITGEVYLYEDAVELVAELTDGGEGTMYEWFDAEDNSLVKEATLTTSDAGVYHVVAEGGLCWGTAETEVMVVTGFEELFNEGFRMYPNPTSGFISLHINKVATGASELYIFNLQGQLIYHQQLEKQTEALEINLSGEREGLYFLQYNNGDERFVEKFFINK